LGKEKETKRLGKKWLCGIALIAIIVSTAFIYFSWLSPTKETFRLKALIVDQGVLTVGLDSVFITNVTNILKDAGYKVDYFSGEEVTVNFYRNLPKQGYEIIILRTHTVMSEAIYTGEQYDKSKNVYEQLNGELMDAIYGNQSYFAITPSFVENSMEGRFRNSTIINMGCGGLSVTSMAEAFVEKGAKVYIGWRESVLADYSDQATELLLRNLITENQTIDQAVNETMNEVGGYPNPTLAYYPAEAGNMTVI
jgi:hypothetical protein